MNDSIAIVETSWARDRDRLLAVRFNVFVEEQGVPDELEEDNDDPGALHLMALDTEGEAVATSRMLKDGHIGRMAVLAGHRGLGIGTAMLARLLELARTRGLQHVWLNAQCSAIDFYRRAGFKVIGGVFDDASIPHQRMKKTMN